VRILALAVLLASMPAAATPRQADIAILGGMVVDGTGAKARRADVLVSGDRIAFVGRVDRKRLQAATVIDAAGRIVTPGFIDNHAHGNPLIARSFDNFLLQGVTTVVLGQDGVSPQAEGTDEADNLTFADWEKASRGEPVGIKGPATLAQWMTAAAARGVDVNIAPLSGFGTNRALAGARTEDPITEAQMQSAETILKADLAAGAFGLSNGLEYVPDRYSTREELVRLARIVGEAGGVVMSHMRSEDSDRIAGAIDELLAQAGPARVHISHLKIVYAREAREADAVLDKIRAARARGVRISADVYPYYAGYADMGLVYPDWAKRRDQWDDAVRNRRAELEAALEARVMKRNGPEAILIASGPDAGKTLKEVADARGLPFVKVLIDVYGYGGPAAAHRVMLPEAQDRFIAAPDIAIGTDGGPWINHPRSWGSYPQVLQVFVRERKAIGLEAAIRKMSSLPAANLGLADRGVVAAGMKADLLVLDAARVVNNASWTRAAAPPSGYDAIIVNGRVAVRGGVRAPERFGRILRRTEVSR